MRGDRGTRSLGGWERSGSSGSSGGSEGSGGVSVSDLHEARVSTRAERTPRQTHRKGEPRLSCLNTKSARPSPLRRNQLTNLVEQ